MVKSRYKKDEIKAKIDSYKKTFSDYLCTCSDNCKLNEIFAEITLFRINHDGMDGIFQNIKDFRKRKQDVTREGLINSQLDDILDNFFKARDNQYEIEFNDLMKRLLPQNSKPKNAWEAFWVWILEGFDNFTGKK